MKQAADTKTLELPMPGAKRGRGRPPSGSAMSSAQRQKAYRERLRESGATRKLPTAMEFDHVAEKCWAAENELSKVKAERDRLAQSVSAHEREHALLLDERCKAFKVAEDARAELEKMARSTSSAGKLASEVLRLEKEKRDLLEDAERDRAHVNMLVEQVKALEEQKAVITAQGAALAVVVQKLEAKLNKRNASQKTPKQIEQEMVRDMKKHLP